ncbi:MAG: glycosyltransferase family 4 protein [Gemmobacter sp.]
MAGSEPHILLIGGDGGFSGVPTYLAQMMRALSGQARFTVLSDRNARGYDFVTALGGRHIEQPGLRTSLSPLRALQALRGLRRSIDGASHDPGPGPDLAPDLVWAHARMALLLLRVLAIWRHWRGRSMPPLAVTFHGLPFGPGHRPLASAVARRIEAAFLRLMPPHHLVFLSQAAAQSFATTLNRDAFLARHQVHVLENCSCLDPLPQRLSEGAPVVVMTGRVSYQKDHDTAARIFGQLPPDWQLVLCGGGTDLPGFRHRFARASGLDPSDIARRVRFLGPVRDIRPILQEADVFLMTSRYEGMPIAALEAFEAGLPIATTDIPGMAEIIAAHPMILKIQGDNPAEAALRIMALVTTWRDDALGNGTGIRAAWADRFSFPHWQDQMAALIAHMTARQKS